MTTKEAKPKAKTADQPAPWMTVSTDPEADAHLRSLKRAQVLALSREERMRWFFLLHVGHPELARVTKDLSELLNPNNDVKLISIIGPTGIGKSTLATSILAQLVGDFAETRLPHEVPFVYINAPANGEHSMSWKTLYRRIMIAAGTPHLSLHRPVEVLDGELHAVRSTRTSLAHLREELEAVIKYRNVRVLIIDEAMHLLRFNENAAIMDTLKSLADIHQTKLVLIGTYQIAPLMIEYGQLARRSAILHYRRYTPPPRGKAGASKPDPKTPNPDKPTEMERAFKHAVSRLQLHWPCAEVPNLEAVWPELMRASLGSVGLLKSQLLQLAWLQMQQEGEAFLGQDLLRAGKPPKQLAKIEKETAEGEAELAGACYGEADFGGAEEMKLFFERLTGKAHA